VPSLKPFGPQWVRVFFGGSAALVFFDAPLPNLAQYGGDRFIKSFGYFVANLECRERRCKRDVSDYCDAGLARGSLDPRGEISLAGRDDERRLMDLAVVLKRDRAPHVTSTASVAMLRDASRSEIRRCQDWASTPAGTSR